MARNLSVIEHVLRDRRGYFDEIRDDREVGRKVRATVLWSVVFFAVYGAVMGSSHSLLQALSSAVKLPLLFTFTLGICAPTLFFFNLILGSNQSLGQNVALMLTAITVTSVILMAFSPIALFFLLTSGHYQFFKLLNVAIFSIAGVVGVVYLSQGMRAVSYAREAGQKTRRNVVRLWVLVYAFVGSQMAWTMRPFLGAPGLRFELFRQLGGNFYANIFASLGEILGFFTVR